MKTAIVIGCLGQDGILLKRHLIENAYQVIGVDLNYIESSFEYAKKPVDICNEREVYELVKSSNPSEIYHLAAVHHSAEDRMQTSLDLFQKSFGTNTFSLIYFLEAMLKCAPQARLFYAASSHIFEETNSVNDESSSINPSSVYGITKATGLFICRYYRKEHALFASCGILYNHESSLRSDNFISKKITKGAIKVRDRLQNKIVLGDLSAEADWGYAQDYVKAMHKLLCLEYSDDFIIATGQRHSVSEFAEIAFQYLGLNWTNYVEENKNILIRKPVCRTGNPNKLMNITGWKPSIDFKNMIKVLLEEEGAFKKD